jgi:hypothetical protein
VKADQRPFQLRFWQTWTQLSSPAEGMMSRTHVHVADENDDDFDWTAHALYSMDEQYRYALAKFWNKDIPPLCALMLNPSTATELILDPTVMRVETRAWDGGYGGFLILNAFALRSTEPKALYSHINPIGRENDRVIDTLAPLARTVLCGWGTHGALQGRGAHVKARLLKLGIVPHVLGLSKDKHPLHPLYQSYEKAIKPWT